MNPQAASDLQLIAWIKSGKTHLFSHLVDRYKTKGMAIAISVTKDANMAEDVLQDSFINAFKSLSKFQPSGSFASWLSKIIFNTSLNAIKKHKMEFLLLDDEVPDDSNSPISDSKLEELENKERVLTIMESMPASEALVMRFFYLMDMTINDIHATTDLSHSNIKTLLHRARKRFRNHWNLVTGDKHE